MRWIKFSIETTTEAVDFVSSLLDELGIQGIQIEDNVPLTKEEERAMYTDIPASLPPDDGSAKVYFYIDPDSNILPFSGDGECLTYSTGSSVRDACLHTECTDYLYASPDELIEKIRKGLEEIRLFVDTGVGKICFEYTEDKDWMNNWKEFFKPFLIADDIVVKPAWEQLDQSMDNGKIVIDIDPGIAFGTGSHETTRLCILAIRKYMKRGQSILDAGCGSGILSIAAAKLGAAFAYGLDIDPAAAASAAENVRLNGLTENQVKIACCNILEEGIPKDLEKAKYDIAVANILADVIIPLAGGIRKFIREGGLFISSGILAEKSLEVEQALIKNGFDVLEMATLGEWVSFTAKAV